MDLSENRSNHPNLITHAQVDQCLINNQTYTHTVIIPTDNEVVACAVKSVSELDEALINQLCQYQPEVIILATGAKTVYPEADILEPLVKQNIGLEVMSNQAAARTFNVLLGDNRQALCLMILQPDAHN